MVNHQRNDAKSRNDALIGYKFVQ